MWTAFFDTQNVGSAAVMLEWTAPLPLIAEWSQDQRRSQRWRRVMQIAVIGLDLAKNVFQVHGIDDSGYWLRVFHSSRLKELIKKIKSRE
jgi:hypothetical protein